MTRTLVGVIGMTYAVLLAVSVPLLSDPFIRFDDYVAYFGEEAGFYNKTLEEGRWLNYWWIARPFTWSSPVNFAVYQLGWAVFAGAAALNALGRVAHPATVATLAALIALSPHAFLMAGWFNTLILGIWILAAFAVATLYLSPAGARWLFLAVAPWSMMAYSTYPLAMFVLVLTRWNARRGLFDLAGLVGLLGLSIGLGMVLMYALNLLMHGHFGIVLADWRQPTPATDVATLTANAARYLPEFLSRLADPFNVPAIAVVNGALLLMALLALLRRHRWCAVYIALGIAVSVALLLVHSLTEGVEVPMRAMLAVWMLFAIAVVRALVAVTPPGRASMVAVVLTLVFAQQLYRSADQFAQWQTATRALASQIPASSEHIFIYGDANTLPGAQVVRILHPKALSYRLRQLTGADAIMCAVEVCSQTPPPMRPGRPLPAFDIADANVFVHISTR